MSISTTQPVQDTRIFLGTPHPSLHPKLLTEIIRPYKGAAGSSGQHCEDSHTLTCKLEVALNPEP